MFFTCFLYFHPAVPTGQFTDIPLSNVRKVACLYYRIILTETWWETSKHDFLDSIRITVHPRFNNARKYFLMDKDFDSYCLVRVNSYMSLAVKEIMLEIFSICWLLQNFNKSVWNSHVYLRRSCHCLYLINCRLFCQFLQVIAKRLLESKQSIPHYYLSVDIKMDDILV